MIERAIKRGELLDALGRAPIVLLTGPRQAGKSTLAREVVGAGAYVYDLEDARDVARLGDPWLTLPRLTGPVVIDEAQHRPDLFPLLRVLADEDARPGRFLVLGSASPDLVGLSAESLAGRVTLVELGGLQVADVGPEALDRLWVQGALPPAFSGTPGPSRRWRDDYVATFLERDLSRLGSRVPATTMRRFWTMIAHYHGQTWNGADLSRSLGVSLPTVRRYLDTLTDALVVRQLQPWFANIAKRQVKAPKVYVRDSGLLHSLLGLDDEQAVLGHPKLGASWEGFVIEQLLGLPGIRDPWYWATHTGAELDLLVTVGATRIGVEVKRTAVPKVTPSMRHALVDLELDRLVVVHAGRDRFALTDQIEAVPAVAALQPGGI